MWNLTLTCTEEGHWGVLGRDCRDLGVEARAEEHRGKQARREMGRHWNYS